MPQGFSVLIVIAGVWVCHPLAWQFAITPRPSPPLLRPFLLSFLGLTQPSRPRRYEKCPPDPRARVPASSYPLLACLGSTCPRGTSVRSFCCAEVGRVPLSFGRDAGTCPVFRRGWWPERTAAVWAWLMGTAEPPPANRPEEGQPQPVGLPRPHAAQPPRLRQRTVRARPAQHLDGRRHYASVSPGPSR